MHRSISCRVLLCLIVLLGAGVCDAQVDELTKFVSPSGTSGEGAGESVSLYGDFAVVGVPLDDALGINAGSAELYTFDGTGWVHTTTLTASDGAAGDRFGASVDLNGDKLIVGARGEGNFTGAAYIYRFDGTTWQEEQKIAAASGTAGDTFGASVGIEGDTAVSFAFGTLFGTVYIYRFDGQSWNETQALTAPEGFDGAISLRGGVLAVGSELHDGTAPNTGAAFVYRNDGGTWVEEQLIAPAELSGGDRFGRAVALDRSGETLVVGSWLDDEWSTDSGAAYVFRFDGSSWVQEQKLTDPKTIANDRLGTSVAIHGDRIALGAPFHDGLDEEATAEADRGAVFLYNFDGESWNMDQRLIPIDGDRFDSFGTSVAVDLGRILVGAPGASAPGGVSGAGYFFAIIDCNTNGIADAADLAGGISFDCDANGIPDECDFAAGRNPDPEAPTWITEVSPIVVANEPGTCGAVATWEPLTALDDCSPVTILTSHEPGTFFPVGITTVTSIASDEAGNSIVSEFTVTVEDHDAPTLVGLSADLTLSVASGTCTAVGDFVPPTATDACSAVEVSLSHAPGAEFPAGTTVVTATAIDAAGNETVGTFAVIVIDEFAPVFITRPPSVVDVCDTGEPFATVHWLLPLVADECGPVVLDGPPASGQFPIGMTVLEYGGTDLSGNRTTVQFAITVVDVEPPVLTVPAGVDLTVPVGECQVFLEGIFSSAVDNSGAVALSTSPELPTLLSPGVHEILVIAADPSGNQMTQLVPITVTDPTPPNLKLVPAVEVSADPGACGAMVSISAGASDCQDTVVTNTLTGTASIFAFFPVGESIVEWNATDLSGNVTTAFQTVTVTAPAADCNGNGISDHCELAEGTALDTNGNGVIDTCESFFLRGDANGDLALDITDPILVLVTLFGPGDGTQCLDAADTNADGAVDLTDAIALLGIIFTGAAEPAAPYPFCGVTAEPIGCVQSGCVTVE